VKDFFSEYVWPYFLGAIVAVLLMLSLSLFAPIQASEIGSVLEEFKTVPTWLVGAGLVADYTLGKSKALKPNSVIDLVILGLQAIIQILRQRKK
jgi:hypothetical protein